MNGFRSKVTAMALLSQVAMTGFAIGASAEVLHPYSGRVTRVSPTEIEIQRGREKVEFARDPSMGGATSGAGGAKDIKVGDRITVWYSLNAKRISPSAGEAGQAPGVKPEPEQKIILDDRAFYNAKNDTKSDGTSKRKAQQGG